MLIVGVALDAISRVISQNIHGFASTPVRAICYLVHVRLLVSVMTTRVMF